MPDWLNSALPAAWVGYLVMMSLILTVLAIRTAWRENSPPGWMAQWNVTHSVLVVLYLAGLDVASFKELFIESSGAIAALVPLILTPWLAFKAVRIVKGDAKAEVEQ